jgi:membrane-bound inhibitor of C-type lysozyme
MKRGLLAIGLALVGCAEAPAPQRTIPPAVETGWSMSCEGGGRLELELLPEDRLRVRAPGGEERVLDVAPAASGMRYAADGFDFHGKGGDALWTSPGKEAVKCVDEAGAG